MKRIFWLTKDEFEGVDYDIQVKVKKQINNITFLIKFKRWERSLADNKFKQKLTTAIAIQTRIQDNIVFLKILNKEIIHG